MKNSRYNKARQLLIFWTLFIGVGAVAGAVGMIVDPSGKTMKMDEMLPYFEVLPFADILFKDFLFSGFALLAVNGITNITAAVLLILKKKSGVILGGIFGVTLMLWICIQFYMFPANFMSTTFFIFGLCQAATGYAAWVFEKQESFGVDVENYRNIGKDRKKLVVFFSRMGYVKRIAFETADKSGACLYEIKSTELTEGTAGFWWCGRFGMHRWDMPIEPVLIDLLQYEQITICTPIWVFALAAPVRSFCRAVSHKVKKADYILVHHTSGKYENAVEEMDSLLGITHSGYKSIQCKKGKYKYIKE